MKLVWVSIGVMAAAFLLLGLSLRVAAQERERNTELVTQTNAALCALRQNVQETQDEAIAYITAVSEGSREPIAGITLREIQDRIASRQATLDALASLECNRKESR